MPNGIFYILLNDMLIGLGCHVTHLVTMDQSLNNLSFGEIWRKGIF